MKSIAEVASKAEHHSHPRHISAHNQPPLSPALSSTCKPQTSELTNIFDIWLWPCQRASIMPGAASGRHAEQKAEETLYPANSRNSGTGILAQESSSLQSLRMVLASSSLHTPTPNSEYPSWETAAPTRIRFAPVSSTCPGSDRTKRCCCSQGCLIVKLLLSRDKPAVLTLQTRWHCAC